MTILFQVAQASTGNPRFFQDGDLEATLRQFGGCSDPPDPRTDDDSGCFTHNSPPSLFFNEFLFF
jgi:hypothetical protein